MRKIKNIVLLSGGDGTRFWPLQKKELFKFCNKTITSYLISQYSQYTEKITVVVNADYYDEYIETIGNKADIIKQDRDKAGMAGAVLSCKNKIKGEVLIVNGEDIFDFEVVGELIGKILNEKEQFIFVAKEVDKYFPGGYLKFVNEKIVEIIEKPKEKETPSKLIKLVIDYFSDINLLISALENSQTKKDDLYEQAINNLFKREIRTDYIVYKGFWSSMKYPWHVLTMRNYFLNKIKSYRGKNVKIHKTAIIEGEVYLEDGVKVMDNVKIVGPTFIGKNSIVASYGMVINSLIEDNVVVGGYSEVTRSYLGSGVMLHRNYVGDSVLAHNVSFGAGSVTANYRFDAKNPSSYVNGNKIDSQLSKLGAIIGANTKIGINVSILPGIKIGKNCMIGPGEIIKEDVEDDKFVFH